MVGVRGFELSDILLPKQARYRTALHPERPNSIDEAWLGQIFHTAIILASQLSSDFSLAIRHPFVYKCPFNSTQTYGVPRMAEDLLHKKQFPPYHAKKGEEYMNAKQLAHFRSILQALKDELLEDIERTVHTMQDEATVFADPNDRASQESDIALELRNRDRERKLIKKVDESIATNRGWGIWLLRFLCGVEIGLKRLEARPTATMCIDCKRLRSCAKSRSGNSPAGPKTIKKGRRGVLFCIAKIRLLGSFRCGASVPMAFIDRRTRPLSSVSMTLTLTIWPSLR
jgi:DnaK suppressor protein